MTLSPLLSRLWRAVLLGALIVTGHASFAEDVIEAKAKICATCHGE
jgi:cytochrome c553